LLATERSKTVFTTGISGLFLYDCKNRKLVCCEPIKVRGRPLFCWRNATFYGQSYKLSFTWRPY